MIRKHNQRLGECAIQYVIRRQPKDLSVVCLPAQLYNSPAQHRVKILSVIKINVNASAEILWARRRVRRAMCNLAQSFGSSIGFVERNFNQNRWKCWLDRPKYR